MNTHDTSVNIIVGIIVFTVVGLFTLLSVKFIQKGNSVTSGLILKIFFYILGAASIVPILWILYAWWIFFNGITF